MSSNTDTGTTAAARPLLSLILCSRNDQYMGNSLWRLETTLNYVAARVQAMRRSEQVEILVGDWGSETPLSHVVRLSDAARRIVSFLWIPPDLAQRLQRDSPFPEVLALNAAARRARGQYIGRIDQDTLVGGQFLEWFFNNYDGNGFRPFPLETTMLFSRRRSIPYRLAAQCPPLATVERAVAIGRRLLRVESAPRWAPFFASAVGIFVVPKLLWHECGGYDEDMIYMGAMETNMIARLMKRYPLVDIGTLVGHDFYHLEHHHPWAVRSCWANRRANDDTAGAGSTLDSMNPNGSTWGLQSFSIASEPARVQQSDAGDIGRASGPFLSIIIAAQVLVESLLVRCTALPKLIHTTAGIWRHRWAVARGAVRGKPVSAWHSVLMERWRNPERSLVYPSNVLQSWSGNSCATTRADDHPTAVRPDVDA